MRGKFFLRRWREEYFLRSEGRAFHRRTEEGKNDLAREADLAERERGFGGDRI